MTDYRKMVIEDLRLAILRVLDALDAGRANTSVLQTAVNGLGHAATRAQVETEAAYLEGVGAVTLERLGDATATVTIVTLTQRGQDHVLRRETLAGVKRPALR